MVIKQWILVYIPTVIDVRPVGEDSIQQIVKVKTKRKTTNPKFYGTVEN